MHFTAFISILEKKYSIEQTRKKVLKRNGNPVMVHFADCSILPSTHTPEPDVTGIPSQNEILNSVYNTNNNTPADLKEVCTIVYETSNKVYKTPALQISPVTLRVLLDEQKTTTIYIDSNNTDNYYFDIEFLERR